ncbi:MAG: NAD(P)-dependent oxidoreductase [Lachnospiraceae bacterium]|nr:NAD(P)-dependent oxidoreductase [Lachnospiraceae bacterium]
MAHYLVTGATGYIGSMLIKELYKRAEVDGTAVEITAIVRDMQRACQMLPEAVRLIEADITDAVAMSSITGVFDYIIHCAAATTSAYMVSNPVETADGIILGTRNMLELARGQQVKGMVYLSSMEVYGSVTDIGRPRREEELGRVLLNSPRSCYPLGKRMAEHYCYIYSKEYGVSVKIARLAQTFGKGVRPEDNRVYMQFARSVIEKRDIVLQTEGKSLGNYCDIEDAVQGILTILESGACGEVYNVVNEVNTMSIRDMAELVAAQVAHGSIKVSVQVQDAGLTGYAPDTGLRLSGEKLRGLGWQPTKDLEDMYRDVIAQLQKGI